MPRCLFLLFFAFLPVTSAFSQPTPGNVKNFSGLSMGTSWNVTLVTDSSAVTQADIQEVLSAVDGRMSTWKPDSELSRINAEADISADIPISPELAKVLTAALEVSRRTGGAYDITVGPLVNLWKFGPGDAEDFALPTEPTESQIAEARERCGWEALEILTPEDGTFLLRRKKAGMYLDLSSIAKGYGVDQVAEMLIRAGETRFMVEVGGEVRVMGRNAKGNPWNIGIETPVPWTDRLFGSVKMEDESLATSGGYRNFREIGGGKTVSHIIDPRTGRPLENAVLAVSILAETCMEADAWATAAMVLGREETETHFPEGRFLFLIQKRTPESETDIVAESRHFPIIVFPAAAGFSKTPEPEAEQAEPDRTSRFLFLGAFLFFIAGIVFRQILGRGRMK